jgi:quinoprotein glucose dehydrogenase
MVTRFMIFFRITCLAVCWAAIFLATPAISQQIPEPAVPEIAAASDEGEAAISQFKYPSRLTATLFAAEPAVANPVALFIDDFGRVFVCETFRQEHGVEDNREHGNWLDADLAAQTVEDRIAYMKNFYPDDWSSRFQAQDDRIRLLVDTDGNGRADSSQVFSDHYNGIAMGTGAGVLQYRDKVFYTCIPHLWLLHDDDRNGVADKRVPLHSGFGVRFAFRGHDMHGLIIGPDGRLYFSIGDRGYHLENGLHDPASGAVFRCELDGSQLEVVATGLRNPQELAFDDHGNLFTGDNNSDSGDRARWVYVVRGGDSGWRMYYQYLNDRGPFNREHTWQPFDPAITPADIVPPIDNVADGPSGLAFYPGTGFGDRFKGRFFLCDFRGVSTVSGVRSFQNEAHGAFFKITDMDETFWQILATDFDFGPDGKIYIADWVFGWVGENKGRVYTFHDPTQIDSPIVKQVQSLLAGAIASLDNDALVGLLGHTDCRVRQEAQFILVDRGQLKSLEQVAAAGPEPLSRLHAIWGIGQIARSTLQNQKTDSTANIGNVFSPTTRELTIQLLNDGDPEIRAQACQLAGESLQFDVAESVATKLGDENLRVQHLAALALNRIGDARHVPAILKMLVENDNQDPIVRHSGIMALSGLVERGKIAPEELAGLAQHENPAVRLAAVVALRKNGSELVSRFLKDPDEQVVTTAARAIHDVPIDSVMPGLAALISNVNANDAIVRRALNANVRLGKPENALALARFSANREAAEGRRMDALDALANWEQPAPRDAVLGDWRPLPKRDWTEARDALATCFADIVGGGEAVTEKAIEAAGKLKLLTVGKSIAVIVEDRKIADATRAAALKTLASIAPDDFVAVAERLEQNFAGLPDQLAGSLVEILSRLDAERGLRLILQILNKDDLSAPDVSRGFARQQKAIQTLGEMTGRESAETLSKLMDEIANGDYEGELRLDVVNACATRQEADLDAKLTEYRDKLLRSNDPTAPYRDTLYGGNAEAGRQIFVGKTEVSCVRCHKVNGEGGEVGPDLSTVGLTRDRQYLLESIVVPNKMIAIGYAQMIVATSDGLTHTGIVVDQTNDVLRLMDADGNVISIQQDEIEGSRMGQSSMPADLVKHLSLSEIRDLIEYLSNRRINEAVVPGGN